MKLRFLKEFFNPHLKCERLGHALVEKTHIIRREVYRSGVVCEDYKAARLECKRCDHKEDWHSEEEVDWYNSVSMPSSYWEEMREKGYRIMRSA